LIVDFFERAIAASPYAVGFALLSLTLKSITFMAALPKNDYC